MVSITIVAGVAYISSTSLGTLTGTSTSVCSAEGGFGYGPNAYIAQDQGILSGVTLTSTCSGGNAEFQGMTLTLTSLDGAINETGVDALRFYWNGSVAATVTFTFSSSGTDFFPASGGGPYGYLLVNSSTAGLFPVNVKDECLGGSGVALPGNCNLMPLPWTSGSGGAGTATGTSGNPVTGLVNLSAPSTVVCPPAGALWNGGSSSCTAGAGGSVAATLAAGPSFEVISFSLSDAPGAATTGSFSVTVSAAVTW